MQSPIMGSNKSLKRLQLPIDFMGTLITPFSPTVQLLLLQNRLREALVVAQERAHQEREALER